MPMIQAILIGSTILAGFIGIAAGEVPGLRANRTGIALACAVLLVIEGAIGLDEAYAAIDLPTIALLLSMMILVANLKVSGFFRMASLRILPLARGPRGLLFLVIAVSGLLSALFLNDTLCIMMTPLVCELCSERKREPIPYLIGVATAANVGSSATLIGNPQNMLIAAKSGIPFGRFLLVMAPPAIIGLGACWLIIVLAFPREFSRPFDLAPGGSSAVRVYKPLLYKSLLAAVAMLAAFLLDAPISLAALAAAAALLITRRIKPERVFLDLDFSLLVFFAGLFAMTAAVSATGAFGAAMEWALPRAAASPLLFSGLSVLISNVVSNVPAVLLLSPAAEAGGGEKAWLLLSMASTLAGNLTLLGSVANLIVAEGAARRGLKLGFWTYLKVGAPVTAITFTIGFCWISLFA